MKLPPRGAAAAPGFGALCAAAPVALARRPVALATPSIAPPNRKCRRSWATRSSQQGHPDRHRIVLQVMIVPPSLCVLAKTACKSFGKTLTAELLDDDVDEHVRLGRQQRAPGIVNRDRSGVGIPLRGPAVPHRAGA